MILYIYYTMYYISIIQCIIYHDIIYMLYTSCMICDDDTLFTLHDITYMSNMYNIYKIMIYNDDTLFTLHDITYMYTYR